MSSGSRTESTRDALPCFSGRITILLSPAFETNKPDQSVSPSLFCTAVQGCASFHFCSPFKEMNQIKYTLSDVGDASLSLLGGAWYISQMVQSWGSSVEKHSSDLDLLPLLGIVKREEHNCTSDEDVQGQHL